MADSNNDSVKEEISLEELLDTYEPFMAGVEVGRADAGNRNRAEELCPHDEEPLRQFWLAGYEQGFSPQEYQERWQDLCPAWIGTRLGPNDFPWEQGRLVPLAKLLDEYTLHDSYWCGFWFEPTHDEALAIIGWDGHWSGGRIPYPDEGPWPTLLIRFYKVNSLRWRTLTKDSIGRGYGNTKEYHDVIAYARSWRTRRRNKDEEPQEAQIPYVTTIFGNQGAIRVLHRGPVHVLCLNKEGDVIPIPGV